MLDCIKFLLTQCINFISMLFRIDVGFTNLGTLMCICYILLPIVLFIATYFRHTIMEEIDESYDEARPRETWSSNEHQYIKTGNGRSFHTNHTRSRSRRYRL